ncbi:M16 family metallopeptidase [Candidatus Cetobacterium colombiensis]|uniref:Insulinase family protein n=1 Tax=Candidatus Cetobacterium colombiensis TaxID=3073100 RepID=A0ABU4WAU3_9FUSO|nr:insulinase family protein [Candidatus Cetobacterium colombiensis]MDX8336275.1 insulinase family protein [Candidatus Cetobacterium colombiensis]
MKKRLFGFALLFLILQNFIFCNIETPLKSSENLISGTLDNGLKYYIFKNKKPEKRASLNLVVKAGSLYEEEAQQGLAHFLEHMAFNGTTKYQKNELVKYLQSLGLSFGGDLNAYTSFSETVYKLQVPTSTKDLEIGFDVLKEWSSEVTLNPKDVESEKNIIIEEWRLRQGIAKRVGDLQKQIIYGDSWYSKRFPIGFPETINSASSELLRNYYTQWYQPQNMAVVAVGDFNTEEVKSFIINSFSSLKNKSDVAHKSFDIPLNNKNSVTIFTDPELTTTNLNIMWKEAISPINSELVFKQNLEKILLNSIVNTRFSIFSKDKDSPYIYSSIYNFPLNDKTGIYAISSLIKKEDIESTLTNLIDNLKDISINGISNTELENEKINLLNNLKTLVNNKDSITNNTFMDSIVDYILNNNTFMEPQIEYDLTNNILKTITSEDLKQIAQNLLSSNYDVLITSRENMKNKLPTEEKVETFINSLLNQNTTSLKTQSLNLNLPELKLIPGVTKKISSEKDYLKFQLSNGIEVFYKETDFDKDKIYFKLTKLQGSSSLNYSEYINSVFLPDILSNSGVGDIDYKSLEIYFKGKNFTVEPYIDDYTQGFIISTNKENLNEALKYFRTLIARPKFDNNIIESTLKTNAELIKNRDFSPKSVLKKTYLEVLNNNNPRKITLDLKDLDYVNSKTLEETFQMLFSNFKDYKLTVTGSIDEETLVKDLDYYFANLPIKNNSKTFKDLNVNYPTDNVQKRVIQGIDKKATVILTFPYHGDFSLENRTLYNGFSNLLNILLIENVREKIGGVYSISSSANLEKLNFGENYLQIIFSTDNKRVDEVIKKVKSTIEEIQKGNFPQNKILDIQKNYELNFETALKTNSFWNNFLEKKNLISDYEFYTPMRYNNIVNFDSIVNFSNRALKINNCVEVTLLPEKED